MTLWFQNSQNQKRAIGECQTLNEVYIAIDKFIEETNARMIATRPGWRPFKRYYTRLWCENNKWIFDVGSHTEFFIWDNPATYEEMNNDYKGSSKDS